MEPEGCNKAVSSVLVANNGLAAVKFIRSIRAWCLATTGNAHSISIVAMASPEDIHGGTEHVMQADRVVEVRGGASSLNYGNPELIVQLAEQCGVDAVWPGWGHASENPDLPRTLRRKLPRTVFLGPPASAMSALGDKIGSTIIAQTVGVPTVPWTGLGLKAPADSAGGGNLVDQDASQQLYLQCCIKNASQATDSCNQVGYPILLKAAWGGGGRGIRKVTEASEVAGAFAAVEAEVPGSPIFATKMMSNCRHLEVQLLADKYHNVASLFTRDCSVQRRHQKLIEEGPAYQVPAATLQRMERDARKLARFINYQGAATVEWLYSTEEDAYYFLEVNPRLQVEHPVTEWISNVNIPSCQVMIGEGKPLHRIPDLRRLFNLTGDAPLTEESHAARRQPDGHVVAVRLTSEDTSKGFEPTSGTVQELSFQGTPHAYGYFSVKNGSTIHELADSQFGHIFAKGATREEAIEHLQVALRSFRFRGESSCNANYMLDLTSHPDFTDGRIHTGWLDAKIASKMQEQLPAWETLVVVGSVLQAKKKFAASAAKVTDALSRGHMAPARLNLTSTDFTFGLSGQRFAVKVFCVGPRMWAVDLNGTRASATAHDLPDDAVVVHVNDVAYTAYAQISKLGTRLTIAGATVMLAKEQDPSKLIAPTSGKLIRYLVSNGEEVLADEAYAEIEVMKSVMPLISPAAGHLSHIISVGSSFASGDLIGTLELQDPDAVPTLEPFTGGFPQLSEPSTQAADPYEEFQDAMKAAEMVMTGYEVDVQRAAADLQTCANHPGLPIAMLHRELSQLEATLPDSMASHLRGILRRHELDLSSEDSSQDGDGGQAPQLPIDDLRACITSDVKACSTSQQNDLEPAVRTLMGILERFDPLHGGNHLHTIRQLLQQFLEVEERFQQVEDSRSGSGGSGGTSQSQGVGGTGELSKTVRLRDTCTQATPEQTLSALISHWGLEQRCIFANSMLAVVSPTTAHHMKGCLARLATLQGPDVGRVALAARRLLEQADQAQMVDAMQLVLSHGTAQDTPITENPIQEPAGKLEDGLMVNPDAIEEAMAQALGRLEPASEDQARGLVTYLQRIYHNFISHGPIAPLGQQSSQQGMCHAIVVHHFPIVLDGQSGSSDYLSAAVAVSSMDRLPAAMEAVDKELTKQGLEHVTKCTLHVMMHDSAATSTLTAAAGKMQGSEYSFAPGSQEFSKPARTEGRTLDRANSQADPGTFQAMATSGFKFLSVLTADQHALSSHVVFGQGVKTNASDLVEASHCASWTGDPTFGHVEPFSGALLELARLAGLARDMSCLKIMRPQIMLFTMLEKEGRVPVRRLFIRRVVRDIKCLTEGAIKSQSRQVMASAVMAELADLLIASLECFKNSRANQSFNEPADWTHIFLACIPLVPITDTEDQQRMTAALRHAARQQMMKHRSELRQAAVGEWEMVIRAADSSCIWRVAVNQEQAYAHDSECVQVTYEAGETERVIGQPAYQPLGKIEHKRAVARRQSTTYCHDFINVFEDALELAWAAHPPQIGAPSLSTVGTPVVSEELILADPSACAADAQVKMVQRPIGQNDIGIVAWVLTLHSPECPAGRKVVAIANDITMGAGAFGPKEYAMFAAAANYGLAHRMPILYLAANSGARFGLAQEVQKHIQVEWEDPADPNKGIKYLYLTDADYQHLTDDSAKGVDAFKASPITSPKGHRHWVVSDVIGGEDGLGVECLSGSGAIASAYSKAFQEGLTMTVVSGRTVGIGAYLARLGRRCIQRSDQPIILTGYTALNKLLGRRVYKSNHQLGGPQVLGFNGVSHLVVDDDLQAAQATLRWLSYLPIHVGDPTRCLPCPDPVDRNIEYAPSEGAKIDPRAALTGRMTGDGWQSGLMDQGSWVEMQRDWARTVIVGRARLGGCPVGVIAAESETQTVTVPADPAIPGSAEATVSQAGQVWYPDSALKTAHAIEEMNKEGLPLVILANWRGFSGGQRDLLDGILQAGSLIVEELRKYRHPVLVYLPPGSELRGGAWVVIDSQINTAAIEMFADPTATGGVLEPEGIVEIKMRAKDLKAAMHRLDPTIKELKSRSSMDSQAGMQRAPSAGTSKEISAREKALMPAYQQVAVAFAGMHDTPVRMIAKGVVKDIVPWEDARRVLATRLRRRLAENAWAQKLEEASETLTHRAALDHVRRVAAAHVEQTDDKGVSWEIDAFFVEWATSEAATQVLQDLLMEVSTQDIDRQVQRMLASAGGRAGLLQLLDKNMKQHEGLREGVQQLL